MKVQVMVESKLEDSESKNEDLYVALQNVVLVVLRVLHMLSSQDYMAGMLCGIRKGQIMLRTQRGRMKWEVWWYWKRAGGGAGEKTRGESREGTRDSGINSNENQF